MICPRSLVTGAGIEESIDVSSSEQLRFCQQLPAIESSEDAVGSYRNLQRDGQGQAVQCVGIEQASGLVLFQQGSNFQQAAEPCREVFVVKMNGSFDELQGGIVTILIELPSVCD